MNYGLLLYLKLARVDVGNVRKKGKKYVRYYYLKCFYRVVFNQTLSIHVTKFPYETSLIKNAQHPTVKKSTPGFV